MIEFTAITAIHEDERVTRLFPGRPRERGDSLAAGPGPGPEVHPVVRGPMFFAELGPRLDEILEKGLCESFSRIRILANVLKDGPSDWQDEPAIAIGEAAERAEEMMRNVLDFVRFTTGGVRIVPRRIELNRLCERVVDAIHTKYPDRSMLFTSDARVEGEWDPDRIATLVSHLVINAIEHGPPRPAIRIGLRASPEQAVFEVWSGGSIDPGLSNRIFEPFARARSQGRGPSAGLGLGLFLAREIARAHGGALDVQSGKSDGATFRVTLPRS
jgi:signal transduction histidine kinase